MDQARWLKEQQSSGLTANEIAAKMAKHGMKALDARAIAQLVKLPDLPAFARDMLREKAFPATIAAQNAYQRALAFACEHHLEDRAAMPEILDGLQRTLGSAPASDAPCPR